MLAGPDSVGIRAMRSKAKVWPAQVTSVSYNDHQFERRIITSTTASKARRAAAMGAVSANIAARDCPKRQTK